MVVALAIAAILTLAAMRAVAQASQAERVDRSTAGAVGRGEAVEAILYQDLLHAQRVRRLQNGFELEGLGRLASGTMETSQLPAVVRYGQRFAGSQSLLTRQQTVEGRKPTTELVALSVKSVAIAGKTADTLPLDKWISMPDEVTVTVTFTDGEIRQVRYRVKQ
jgi:type II secretory pathway component PulJ